MDKLLDQDHKANKWQIWEPSKDYPATCTSVEVDVSRLLFRLTQYYQMGASPLGNFTTNKSTYKQNPSFKVHVSYILDGNTLTTVKGFIISYKSYLWMCQRIRVQQSKFQASKLIFFKSHKKPSWRFVLVQSPGYKNLSQFSSKWHHSLRSRGEEQS